MSAWMEITNTATGETRMVFDPDFFSDPRWEEANLFFWRKDCYSCDCARSRVFWDDDTAASPCNIGPPQFHVARAYTHDGRIVQIDGEGEG